MGYLMPSARLGEKRQQKTKWRLADRFGASLVHSIPHKLIDAILNVVIRNQNGIIGIIAFQTNSGIIAFQTNS